MSENAAVIAALHKLRADLEVAALKSLDASLQAAVDDARATTLFNDQSTKTRGSIYSMRRGDLTGEVVAKGAAHFLEFGIKAATEMRTVRFADGTFRRFRHPGIKARPFMAHAKVAGELAATFESDRFVNEAVATFNGA